MEQNGNIRTLTVDIGGSGIKVIVLDIKGMPLTQRIRLDTPRPATPEPIINTIVRLASSQGNFQRVSVGFPGVIRYGVVETAVNLHPEWLGFNLEATLSNKLQKPVRVINDADMQGLSAISGKGVELVLTLGTGFGSALFINGKLIPNLELGHHKFRKGETYEEQLGRVALKKIGQKKWNRRLKKATKLLQNVFNYEYLYIGGGEARKVQIDLASNVKIIPNVYGLLGGIALWRD
ncbi:MAG: ROK family protein [Cyanobacteria bacterium J06639_18]